MSASTRLIFTIAGCALGLAAVGTIALCLVVAGAASKCALNMRAKKKRAVAASSAAHVHVQ